MTSRKEPVVPFVEARNVGGSQRPTAIVLSLSCTTSDKGAALGVAQYHHNPNAPYVSYHYILDEADAFRCVPSNVAAYGNPHNAINVLLCAQPHEVEPMWEDATAKRVLHRAADLVAELVLVHRIRPRYISGKEEERWRDHKWRRRGGIIIRPIGAWPYESFLRDVHAQLEIKKANF